MKGLVNLVEQNVWENREKQINMVKLNIFLFLIFSVVARLSASEYVRAMDNLKSPRARQEFLTDRLTELKGFSEMAHPYKIQAFAEVYRPKSPIETELIVQLKEHLKVFDALESDSETMVSQFSKFSQEQRTFFWHKATSQVIHNPQDEPGFTDLYKKLVKVRYQNLIDFTESLQPRDDAEKDACDTLKQLLVQSQPLDVPIDFEQLGGAFEILDGWVSDSIGYHDQEDADVQEAIRRSLVSDDDERAGSSSRSGKYRKIEEDSKG